MRTSRPTAIFFDMFGTLVSIDAERLPRRIVEGREQIATIADLEHLLDRLDPRVSVRDLFTSLERTGAEMEREKLQKGHIELPSRERFRRALEALNLEGPCEEIAITMSERHMESLAAAVVCPPDRRNLLDSLGADYRVGLISNFDHGATARSLLDEHGLAPLLDPIVVSDDVGVRKPGSKIFEIACERMGVTPQECLYVGDSYAADVEGATNAGLDVVWIDEGDEHHRPAIGKTSDVRELPQLLRSSFGQT